MSKSSDDYVQQDIARSIEEKILDVLRKFDGYLPSFRIAEALGLPFDEVNDLVACLYWHREHDIQRVVHTDRVEYAIFYSEADED